MTRRIPLAALAALAAGCGSGSYAEITSTVSGLDEVGVVYHGGEHILLFDRKVDCLDVFWVNHSYINGQSPNASIDFVALQFSYDADAPIQGNLSVAGESAVNALTLENLDGAFFFQRAGDGIINAVEVSDEAVEADFDLTFDGATVSGTFRSEYCRNIK